MARTSTKKDPFREALKSVVSEIVEENEGAIKRILEEVIEDAVMSGAIKSCKLGRRISRKRIMETLSQISK